MDCLSTEPLIVEMLYLHIRQERILHSSQVREEVPAEAEVRLVEAEEVAEATASDTLDIQHIYDREDFLVFSVFFL